MTGMGLQKEGGLPQPAAGSGPPGSGILSIRNGEILFLSLLFLSFSTPYRLYFDNFTVSVTELGAWLYVLWRMAAGGGLPPLTPAVRWLRRGFWTIAAWSLAVFMLSANWDIRRDQVIEWLLAALVLESLLRSPIRNWKGFAVLLVLTALPNAVLGWQQNLTGVGLAGKDFFGWSEEAASSPVFGFFGHSNDLAVYLYWPFLLSCGLTAAFRSRRRILFGALTVLLGSVLVLTISRSTLFTLLAVGVLLGLLVLAREKYLFLGITAGGGVLALLAARLMYLTQPIRLINRFLSGRLTLWARAWQLVAGDPLLLPFGFLQIHPAESWIFWVPHNIYLLAWIEFGWPGLLLQAGLALFFLATGWRRYATLRADLPAAILWLGLAAEFLLNGMFSLYLHEPYVVVGFTCIVAVWILQLGGAEPAAAPDGRPRTI
jgi:hypothetical protein